MPDWAKSNIGQAKHLPFRWGRVLVCLFAILAIYAFSELNFPDGLFLLMLLPSVIVLSEISRSSLNPSGATALVLQSLALGLLALWYLMHKSADDWEKMITTLLLFPMGLVWFVLLMVSLSYAMKGLRQGEEIWVALTVGFSLLLNCAIVVGVFFLGV